MRARLRGLKARLRGLRVGLRGLRAGLQGLGPKPRSLIFIVRSLVSELRSLVCKVRSPDTKSEPRAQGLGNRGGDHRPAAKSSKVIPNRSQTNPQGDTPPSRAKRSLLRFARACACFLRCPRNRSSRKGGRGEGKPSPLLLRGSKHFDQGSTDFQRISKG